MVGKEKYFRILGIDPTSDQNTIKKAYRKKALRYHPDKNKSPDAHALFIKITDAYEILSGQQQVRSSTGATYKTKTKEEVFAEKVKAAKERWKYQQAEEARKDREYYQRVAFGWKWKVFQTFAVYTAIFSCLLICDYYLDGKEKSYNVNDNEVVLDSHGQIVSINDEHFIVGDMDFWWGKGRMPIRANYSYLFGDMKSISVMLTPVPTYQYNSHSYNRMSKYVIFEDKELYTTMSSNSIYGVFPVLHAMFMVPLILIIFKRPTLRFNIWRFVSIWIIYPVIIFFTFNNNRIFHLIELLSEG